VPKVEKVPQTLNSLEYPKDFQARTPPSPYLTGANHPC